MYSMVPFVLVSRGAVVKEANSLEEHRPGGGLEETLFPKQGRWEGGWAGEWSTCGHVFLYLLLSHHGVNVLILSPTIILYLGNNFAISWVF